MPRSHQFISHYLIGITVAVFLLQIAFSPPDGAPPSADWFTMMFAFTPALAFRQPWTFVSAIFLHGDVTHIFFNMFALYMFGPLVEIKLGQRRFLLLYFATGILGNLGFYLLSPDPAIPGLGASGAIYGLLGALAMLEPHITVYMMFLTPMPLWLAAVFWAIINLAGTVFALGAIGYSAHLAGLGAGALYAWWLKKKHAKFADEYRYLDY